MPRFIFSEATDGVERISGPIDRGLAVHEVTVTARASRWAVPPGTVVQIENEGPYDGKWLVETVRKGSFKSKLVEIALKKPMAEKLEPAPETETSSTDIVGRRRGGPGSGPGGGTGLREEIVRIAKESMTVNSGFKRYSQSGLLTDDPTPSGTKRTDCSQWARACYLQAGAADPGAYTGDMLRRGKKTNKPKPGDLLCGPNHVEMYIGGGKTIGHGSPPIDYSSVNYWKGQGFVFLTYDFLDANPAKPIAREIADRLR